MAKFEFRLSAKVNPEGRQEIMIRLFHGSKINLRAKSRIFIDPQFFEYFIDKDKTEQISGVKVPSKNITSRTDYANKKGWILFDRGKIVISNRIETPELKEARKAETKLDELKNFITAEYEKTNVENLNSEWLKSMIDLFHDGAKIDKKQAEDSLLINRFRKMIDSNELITKNGTPITQGRKAHYKVMASILERYLIINGKTETKFSDVDKEFILDFRDFMINENNFVEDKKWSYLYKDMKKNNKPTEERSLNTVAMKLKIIQTFFKILFANGEIEINPFQRFTDTQHSAVFKQEFTEPFSLSLSELQTISAKKLPKYLEPIRNAFIVQCCLGCRVSDFRKMKMENIILKEGIPFVEYSSQKTGKLTRTPLIPLALNIIKECGFDFPILRNVNGEKGFNKQIKSLLKECGIDRLIETGKEEGRIVKTPLWQLASSKLPRKTNVTLCTRIQLHTSLAGLHKEGSPAIGAYLNFTDEDRYYLMCKAFGEEPVKVNKKLEPIK